MADPRRRSPFKGLTVRMPGAPTKPSSVPPPYYKDDDITDVDAAPPTDASNRAEAGERDAETGIEVVLVREEAIPKRVRTPWRAVEVWTKNRVYGMDATLNCIEVIDRATGKLDPDHPILGGRLGGGRRRTGRGATFTTPLPLPGTEAMFMRAKKQAYTSAVERVLVRVRALRVRSTTTWDQLALGGDDDRDA
jgi:hypothetical protein